MEALALLRKPKLHYKKLTLGQLNFRQGTSVFVSWANHNERSNKILRQYVKFCKRILLHENKHLQKLYFKTNLINRDKMISQPVL